MSRKSYLAKNTGAFALGSFGVKAINFFLVPLYTHLLTTTEYGTIDLVTTIVTVLAPVLMLNISESVMRFALDKGADKNKILGMGIKTLGCAAVVGLVILPIVHLFASLEPYAVFIYLYILSLMASQLFLYHLRGQEKVFLFSVGNLINTGTIAVLNIIFLSRFHMGVRGYFSAYIIAGMVTAAYAFIAGRGYRASFKRDGELAKKMIAFSAVLIPNTFMWWIINASDRIMVTAMVGAAANGIYAISYKLPSLLTSVSVVFNQAWSYSAIKEKDSKDRTAYVNKVYNGLVGLTCFAAVLMMVAIRPFLKIYVADAYYEAWKYTPFLIIGFAILTLGTFLAESSYKVEKDSKGYLFSATTGAILNIILNLLLIPRIGVSGAALASCISYAAVFMYRAVDTRKYVKINVIHKKHLIAFLTMIICGFVLYIPNIWVAEIIMCFICACMIYLFRRELFGTLKKRVNKK